MKSINLRIPDDLHASLVAEVKTRKVRDIGSSLNSTILEKLRATTEEVLVMTENNAATEYRFEVRRPYLEVGDPQRWQQANTISKHTTLKAAWGKLKRMKFAAKRTGGSLQDEVCELQENGTWEVTAYAEEDDEYPR